MRHIIVLLITALSLYGQSETESLPIRPEKVASEIRAKMKAMEESGQLTVNAVAKEWAAILGQGERGGDAAGQEMLLLLDELESEGVQSAPRTGGSQIDAAGIRERVLRRWLRIKQNGWHGLSGKNPLAPDRAGSWKEFDPAFADFDHCYMYGGAGDVSLVTAGKGANRPGDACPEPVVLVGRVSKHVDMIRSLQAEGRFLPYAVLELWESGLPKKPVPPVVSTHEAKTQLTKEVSRAVPPPPPVSRVGNFEALYRSELHIVLDHVKLKGKKDALPALGAILPSPFQCVRERCKDWERASSGLVHPGPRGGAIDRLLYIWSIVDRWSRLAS